MTSLYLLLFVSGWWNIIRLYCCLKTDHIHIVRLSLRNKDCLQSNSKFLQFRVGVSIDDRPFSLVKSSALSIGTASRESKSCSSHYDVSVGVIFSTFQLPFYICICNILSIIVSDKLPLSLWWYMIAQHHHYPTASSICTFIFFPSLWMCLTETLPVEPLISRLSSFK